MKKFQGGDTQKRGIKNLMKGEDPFPNCAHPLYDQYYCTKQILKPLCYKSNPPLKEGDSDLELIT